MSARQRVESHTSRRAGLANVRNADLARQNEDHPQFRVNRYLVQKRLSANRVKLGGARPVRDADADIEQMLRKNPARLLGLEG